MKRHWIHAAALVLLMIGVPACAATMGGPWRPRPPRHAPPVVHVDVSIFYDELAPYGYWVMHGSLGWVWTPYDVPFGWRPYTHGHWVYTDCGWTWVSHWRWGWGPFHYGRWLFDADYGWIWVPGRVWAPAWVVWRWSDDWVGWAPLPPDVGWQVGVGLSFGDRHPRWDLDASWWSFTRPRWLLDRSVRYKLEPPQRNVTFIGRTRPSADYDEFQGHPRNRGWDVAAYERVVHRKVQRLRVAEASDPGETWRTMDRGEARVYRPPIAPAPDKRPRVAERVPGASAPEKVRSTREREMERLEAFYREQRSRLETRQQAEMRQATPDRREELRRRQDEERRALNELRERERKVRESRIEKRIEKPAPAARPAPREKSPRTKGNR